MLLYLLIFFLDALRYDYIQQRYSPYIYKMTKNGFCARLKPVLGYSCGITASLWTGTYPSTHGYWFYWGAGEKIEKKPSIFRIFKIFPEGKLRVLAKHVFWYLLIKTHNPAQAWFMPSLPEDLLPYFSKKSDDLKAESFVNSIPTLFHLLKEAGVGYSWRETRSMKAHDFNAVSLRKSEDFVEIVSIPNFDALGHDFGPNSDEVKKELSRLDSFVGQVVEKYSSTVKNLHVLLFSDHGMAEITKRVDVKGLIDRLPLKPIKDYIGFYDSTVARFWVFNDGTRRILLGELEKIRDGRIIESEELEREGVFFQDKKYGDIVFQMNEGIEIFPNYFLSIVPTWIRQGKGMHGYYGFNSSQHGIFLYHGTLDRKFKPVDIIRVVDVMPTILDILGLPKPSLCPVSLLEI